MDWWHNENEKKANGTNQRKNESQRKSYFRRRLKSHTNSHQFGWKFIWITAIHRQLWRASPQIYAPEMRLGGDEKEQEIEMENHDAHILRWRWLRRRNIGARDNMDLTSRRHTTSSCKTLKSIDRMWTLWTIRMCDTVTLVYKAARWVCELSFVFHTRNQSISDSKCVEHEQCFRLEIVNSKSKFNKCLSCLPFSVHFYNLHAYNSVSSPHFLSFNLISVS